MKRLHCFMSGTCPWKFWYLHETWVPRSKLRLGGKARSHANRCCLCRHEENAVLRVGKAQPDNPLRLHAITSEQAATHPEPENPCGTSRRQVDWMVTVNDHRDAHLQWIELKQ